MKYLGILLIALGILLPLSATQPMHTQHWLTHDFVELPQKEQAALEGSPGVYEQEGTFLSEVFESEQSFQLLGMNWIQDLPESTSANLEVRFRSTDGTWSNWEHLHPDEDGPETKEGLWSYMITEDSDAFQYRALLSTKDSALTPKLADISFDTIHGGEESPLRRLSKLIFQKDGTVTSRKAWGANESLRLASTFGGVKPSDINSEADAEPAPYPDAELQRVLTKDESGRDLWWPLQYSKNTSKIVIHHTASSSNLNNPAAAVRAIYQYHTITRGWGDIGYNYIIAPDGTIFEGRYGGKGVVGAHAAGYNIGSVGIALLGNYQDADIPAPMMESLTGLVYRLAEENNIDVDGKKRFRGKMLNNLLAHRDVSATACPGEVSYALIDDLRAVVGASLDAGRHDSHSARFAYEEVTDRELLTLAAGEKETVTVQLKNTGTQAWNSSTFLTVNANREADELASIVKDNQKRVARMKESSVAPGKTATFTFDVTGKARAGLAYFDMVPVFNGTSKSDTLMELGVYVEAANFDFSVSKIDAPTTLKTGASASVTVSLKNTGGVTWTNNGSNKVTLKRSGTSTLTTVDTLATLKESSVAPGRTGTFTFNITGPSKQGSTSLNFKLFMPDTNLESKSSGKFSVTVGSTSTAPNTGSASGILLEAASIPSFKPGETLPLWIRIQNNSSTRWQGSDVSLALTAPNGFTLSNVRMGLRSLGPNMATRINFSITAPQKEGTYTLAVQPKLGQKALLASPYAFTILVDGTASAPSPTRPSEDAIRIKLTPDNSVVSPQVTSNKAFALSDGTKTIADLAAGTQVTVEKASDKYRVTAGRNSWIFTKPPRFVPSSNGIMEVLNMEQRPAWNTKLNDNLFRGIIEVRSVDGGLALINELPIEDYLKGIGEVSNDAEDDKAKTILVLARSYAVYYTTLDEKFPGKPYDLDDTPEASQKYLGYGFEKRSPKIASYVEATKYEVVTYDGKVIKTPYFTQTDGTATRSAESVWGWKNTPYLVSVPDTFCKDPGGFLGHGVGLSGCGATALAEQGKSYKEIIEYYYTGAKVQSL